MQNTVLTFTFCIRKKKYTKLCVHTEVTVQISFCNSLIIINLFNFECTR